MNSNLKTIVMDNGTGYTKMGYAGNISPSYVIPTIVADHFDKGNVQISKLHYDQLDFFIGDDSYNHSNTHSINWPIKSGIITNWELMEKLWHRSIFDYMRCEPDEHVFILTEPPMNPPENRENMAEVFFETFNVKGLYIGVQAVLALVSNSYSDPTNTKSSSLTGTVIDSGDGVTHIIPISDGFVIGSCIKSLPLAGRDITKFFMQMLKDRGEPIPNEDLFQVAKQIKEKYSYVCSDDLVKEFEKFDHNPEKKFKKFDALNSITGKKYTIDVGYEQFMGPEMYFKPEFIDKKYRTSIDLSIDNAIQSCPIDTRRKLYENIVLSGGSSLTKRLNDRVEEELQKRVNNRLNKFKEATGFEPKPIKVNVGYNPYQNISVWQGGSLLATQPQFEKSYHTREDYFEIGPSIARHNPVFSLGM